MADIEGFQALVHGLLSIEAKLNLQSKLLIEITDILTHKKPGQTEKEYNTMLIEEHRKVLEKLTTDTDLINAIKKMK